MEELFTQSPTLAFIGAVVIALLGAIPGIYAIWNQRNKTQAEVVRTDAEAAEIIGRAYKQLQDSYLEMIEAIQSDFKECAGKIDKLTTEIAALKAENEKLILENVALCEEMKKLEIRINELTQQLMEE